MEKMRFFLFFPVAPALGDKSMMMGEKCSGDRHLIEQVCG